MKTFHENVDGFGLVESVRELGGIKMWIFKEWCYAKNK